MSTAVWVFLAKEFIKEVLIPQNKKHDGGGNCDDIWRVLDVDWAVFHDDHHPRFPVK